MLFATPAAASHSDRQGGGGTGRSGKKGKHYAHSGRRERSWRRSKSRIQPFNAPAVAPTTPGEGPGR